MHRLIASLALALWMAPIAITLANVDTCSVLVPCEDESDCGADCLACICCLTTAQFESHSGIEAFAVVSVRSANKPLVSALADPRLPDILHVPKR